MAYAKCLAQHHIHTGNHERRYHLGQIALGKTTGPCLPRLNTEPGGGMCQTSPGGPSRWVRLPWLFHHAHGSSHQENALSPCYRCRHGFQETDGLLRAPQLLGWRKQSVCRWGADQHLPKILWEPGTGDLLVGPGTEHGCECYSDVHPLPPTREI